MAPRGQPQAIAKDRMRRALLAFQAAYWAGPRHRILADMQLAAAEVEAAFQEFTAAGLVVSGIDRPMLAEARRYLAEDMTTQEHAAATDRLRRALLAFQAAQNLLLKAHRRLEGLPAEEVEAFWAETGGRIERHVQATATEVAAAFQVFSAAGLIACAEDRHRVTEAQRHLTESEI